MRRFPIVEMSRRLSSLTKTLRVLREPYHFKNRRILYCYIHCLVLRRWNLHLLYSSQDSVRLSTLPSSHLLLTCPCRPRQSLSSWSLEKYIRDSLIAISPEGIIGALSRNTNTTPPVSGTRKRVTKCRPTNRPDPNPWGMSKSFVREHVAAQASK